MLRKVLQAFVLTTCVLLAIGCSAHNNDGKASDNAGSSSSVSSSQQGTRMLSAKEAEEELRLDDWVCTRTRQCDDGIRSWVSENQALDSKNRPIQKVELLSDGTVNFTSKNRYNETGQLVSTDKYDSKSKWIEGVYYRYDSNGLLVEMDEMDSLGSAEQTIYEYSTNGVLISEKSFYPPEDGRGDRFLRRETIRDEQGEKLSETEYTKADGETVPAIRYTYRRDENNRIAEVVREDRQGTKRSNYEYSADGSTLKIYEDGNLSRVETFDEVGNTILQEFADGTRWKIEYNSFSQETHKKAGPEGSQSGPEYYYEYDEHGLKVAEWSFSETQHGDRIISAKTYDYVNSVTGETVKGPDPYVTYSNYPPINTSGNASSSIDLSSLVGHWAATDNYSNCKILIHGNGDLDLSISTPMMAGSRKGLLNIADGDIGAGITFQAYADHQCTLTFEADMLHLTGDYEGLMSENSKTVDLFFTRDTNIK